MAEANRVLADVLEVLAQSTPTQRTRFVEELDRLTSAAQWWDVAEGD